MNKNLQLNMENKQRPAKKENKTKNPCLEGYEMRGLKIKKAKQVPNCVPVKNK